MMNKGQLIVIKRHSTLYCTINTRKNEEVFRIKEKKTPSFQRVFEIR